MGEQILTDEQIAENALKEFLQSELGDYSFTWTIKREPDYDNNNYSFKVIYTNPSNEKHSLRFYYDSIKEDLFIECGEDCYEMVRTFDWHVKYFWMLIKW